MKFEKRVTQFFTTEEEQKKAKEFGIDMSDSQFVVLTTTKEIVNRDEYTINDRGGVDVFEGKDYFPTYTLSEILYKLPEWISEPPYNGSIKYLKDAPFYGFCLYSENDIEGKRTQEDIDARIECINEYPIRSAMQMLFQCAKNPKLWYVKKVNDK